MAELPEHENQQLWRKELAELLGAQACHRLCLCYSIARLFHEVSTDQQLELLKELLNKEQPIPSSRMIEHIDTGILELRGRLESMAVNIAHIGIFSREATDSFSVWLEPIRRVDLPQRALMLDFFMESQGVLYVVYKKNDQYHRFSEYINTVETHS